MSSDDRLGIRRRGEPRVPFAGGVRLRYRLFQDFLEQNAANISRGGMFICTTQPGEVASQLEFEIRLEDGFTLIVGRGEVAWARQPGDATGEEPGMGVRFLELAEESRALVEKIVRERVAAGEELFDLEGHGPVIRREAVIAEANDGQVWELGGAPRRPDFAAPSPPGAPVLRGAARARSSPQRLATVAVLSALVGAAAVLVFYWLFVQPSIVALETRIDELAGAPGGPWQPPAAEPPPLPVTPDSPTDDLPATLAADPSSEVLEALRRWSAAWSEQRTEDYLSSYAADFEPPDGLDRATWEASRAARVERPEWIRVGLTLAQVTATGPDSAEVVFVQSYRSARYNDRVRKSLSMVLRDGQWKIARERSLP
jgi:uncharacterized protein (TIGR02266 family)